MPQSKIEYSILISSPSDVAEERKVAIEVIKELTKIWGRQNGAVLRAVAWELDCGPGFDDEPQAVINKGLGEEWDVYLGIMHTRFGTPTKGFGSGTEEEFQQAYQLWTRERDSRILMLYFKKGRVEPDSIDLDQLRRVREFKAKIGGLGGCYREYEDSVEFGSLLRVHLANQLSTLHNRDANQGVATRKAELPFSDEESYEAVLPGFLDHLETALSGFGSITQAIEAVGSAASRHTKAIEAATLEMSEASQSGDVSAMRRAIAGMSKTLRELARDTSEQRRAFSLNSGKAFESFSHAISAAWAFKPSEPGQQDELKEAIRGAMDSVKQLADSVSNTEAGLNSIPHVARELTAAKLLVNREFSELRRELMSAVSLMGELLNSIP